MVSKGIKSLGIFTKYTPFEKGLGASLPESYKKFYKEWKLTEPTAVNYVPEEGRWKRDDVTNEVLPIQNIPIPLKFPNEYDSQIWGGEAVVQGFQKRDSSLRRVPHFWVPQLHRAVVYSEVLDKHISVIITDRTQLLINSNYGFDHYLLKTPACDLKSLLPLGLKRKILQELLNECPTYLDKPDKQKSIYNQYKQYLASYTPEDIDWYGYSYKDACKKMQVILDNQQKIVPLKTIYRAELLQKLKEAQISEAQGPTMELGESSSWMKKINPFGKKHET